MDDGQNHAQPMIQEEVAEVFQGHNVILVDFTDKHDLKRGKQTFTFRGVRDLAGQGELPLE